MRPFQQQGSVNNNRGLVEDLDLCVWIHRSLGHKRHDLAMNATTTTIISTTMTTTTHHNNNNKGLLDAVGMLWLLLPVLVVDLRCIAVAVVWGC
jgi:hypothetical protein